MDERALLVAQRQREPVDLRLGGEGDLALVLAAEEAAHARDEIGDVLVGERVAERQHRHAMPDLGEFRGWPGADLVAQGLAALQVGKALLERDQPAALRVIGGVVDDRRIVLEIGTVGLRDLGRQRLVLGARLARGEVFDGNGISFAHDRFLRAGCEKVGTGFSRRSCSDF
jgi:hypothetical protein